MYFSVVLFYFLLFLANSSPVYIPEELLDLLNDVNDFEDYLKYVRRNVSNGDGSVNIRFGADDVEKKSVTPYKFAKCEPEEQTVSINIDDQNPRHLYVPKCVRVKRCGGCCTNSIHTCIPVANTTVIFEIMGLEYSHGMQLDKKESKYVSVEVHTKCKCMCKGSAKDCNASQRFDKSKCQCVCSNKDEQSKCHANNLKQWDPKMCLCVCRNFRECSTNFKFNPHTCSCEAERAIKRNLESRRRRGDEGVKTQSRTVQPLYDQNN